MPSNDVTEILLAASQGDRVAVDRLLEVVYEELRRLAAGAMRSERADHTLQPAALVHETYLRLINQKNVPWQNRAHFFAVAARAMRQILVEHARKKGAAKRGGSAARLELHEQLIGTFENVIDVVALDEALTELGKTHERHVQIVEARFFGGMSIEETAAALEVSTSTVEREWRYARARLYTMLSDETKR